MEPIRTVEENTRSKRVSTRSGLAGVIDAGKDSKSVPRSVVEKKPKQLSGAVTLVDATAWGGVVLLSLDVQ